MSLYDDIFRAFDGRDVRYVTVGGIAVVLHGYLRLTLDLDLVVDLQPAPARRAIEALTEAGFVPLPPVDPLEFADPRIRQSWVEEKNMQVFQMRDPERVERRIDLFAEEPIPFEDLWTRAKIVDTGGVRVRIASIEDLIELKRRAGRAKDMDDIEVLEELRRRGLSNDD